jgi:hypothetical protein
MALIVCHVIAYLQIMSAGFNLWGVDPRIIFTVPFGRNTFLVGLFMVVQVLGLIGAILILQNKRRGFVLSIAHHVLLLPALVVTGTGLVMLMDDRVNLTLLFMSKPGGGDVGLYWSLGWNTVFQQVTRNVPTGSTYIGINLFAMACIFQLWTGLDEMNAEDAREEREMRRRERQTRRQPLALPPPKRHPQQQPYPQEQRVRPQQPARQPRRPPPSRWDY